MTTSMYTRSDDGEVVRIAFSKTDQLVPGNELRFERLTYRIDPCEGDPIDTWVPAPRFDAHAWYAVWETRKHLRFHKVEPGETAHGWLTANWERLAAGREGLRRMASAIALDGSTLLLSDVRRISRRR